MPVRYEAFDGRPPEIAKVVDEGLDASNHERAPLDAVDHVTCLARDDAGSVIGGAVGRTWGECAELLQLWVSPAHRRQGIGKALVQQFEARVAAQGCQTCYLTTFSFQAPDLYRALGYAAVSEIRGFPQGIAKYLMVRTLNK
ncbi:MAG: GNAT family N-acetyltransferase [Burkholderiales bacterium]